jgi:uncharacterized Zn-binding protein involved in type VI secretion
MPAVARANAQDDVFSLTGTGKFCRAPIQTKTGTGTSTVFAGGAPVVLQGDRVGIHPYNGCGTDTSTLTSGSSTVFANGKQLGRIGDQYTSDNIIISGCYTVFSG